MKKNLSKILLITIFCLFVNINDCLASNTKSIDLESSSSQYLSITDANQTGLDITGDISIMGWISIERLPSSAGVAFAIVSKWDTGSDNRSWQLFLNSDDTLFFDYTSGGVTSSRTRSQTTGDFVVAGDIGNWVHFAVTVDSSEKSITFYKNGSSVSKTDLNTVATSIYDSSAMFAIGVTFASGSANSPFDGKMDEIGIYNSVLTSGTISSDYNSGNGTERSSGESNIVSGWRFEDDLLDLTANNNDLTNSNSAAFSTDVPFSGSAPATTRRIFIIN